MVVIKNINGCHLLKALSLEVDLAESGLTQQIFIKGRRNDFQRTSPAPKP
jgi:hypothetical protein